MTLPHLVNCIGDDPHTRSQQSTHSSLVATKPVHATRHCHRAALRPLQRPNRLESRRTRLRGRQYHVERRVCQQPSATTRPAGRRGLARLLLFAAQVGDTRRRSDSLAARPTMMLPAANQDSGRTAASAEGVAARQHSRTSKRLLGILFESKWS